MRAEEGAEVVVVEEEERGEVVVGGEAGEGELSPLLILDFLKEGNFNKISSLSSLKVVAGFFFSCSCFSSETTA